MKHTIYDVLQMDEKMKIKLANILVKGTIKDEGLGSLCLTGQEKFGFYDFQYAWKIVTIRYFNRGKWMMCAQLTEEETSDIPDAFCHLKNLLIKILGDPQC